MTILDLNNWSAKGATAELLRKRIVYTEHWVGHDGYAPRQIKCVTMRLSFRLSNAPPVLSLCSVGRGKKTNDLIPDLLAVEYSKMNDGEWRVTALRVYGKREDKPEESAVNIYPHDKLNGLRIPAWIRDAAIDGMPSNDKRAVADPCRPEPAASDLPELEAQGVLGSERQGEPLGAR